MNKPSVRLEVSETMANATSMVAGAFWGGIGLALLFKFTAIGNNIVAKAWDWTVTNASEVT